MLLVILVAVVSWCALSLPLGMVIGFLLADHDPERPPGSRFELAA